MFERRCSDTPVCRPGGLSRAAAGKTSFAELRGERWAGAGVACIARLAVGGWLYMFVSLW